MKKSKNDIQIKNVSKYYDDVANIYDSVFEIKSEYQISKILVDIFERNKITSGLILDIGCGTGGLKKSLDNNFRYKGIDVSAKMAEKARSVGYEVIIGSAEEKIASFADKSVDHVVALSSVYFIENIEKLVKEFERVSRKTIFISFEKFEPGVIEIMKKKGINIFNHDPTIVSNPTEHIKNIYLWKSPTLGNKINGDIIFKRL
jgi:ubiquinone/menaquinone biosynthesis C-methylase UbiE